MTEEELELHKSAIAWVRANAKGIFQEITEGKQFDGNERPAATFMAGTPGAGKTEFSKRYIEFFNVKPLRIDTDELREKIPGYNGKNSSVVQAAANKALEMVLDKVLHKKIPFILDTTFSVGKAVENLKRADRKGYSLQILFIYQDPVQAWDVTRARELTEGRVVPKDIFINSYFKSKENCRLAKEYFGDKLDLTMIVKNFKDDSSQVYLDISEIDKHLPRVYTNSKELGGLIND